VIDFRTPVGVAWGQAALGSGPLASGSPFPAYALLLAQHAHFPIGQGALLKEGVALTPALGGPFGIPAGTQHTPAIFQKEALRTEIVQQPAVMAHKETNAAVGSQSTGH